MKIYEAWEGRLLLWFYVDRDSLTHLCSLDWSEKIPARADRALCGAKNTTRARRGHYTVNDVPRVRCRPFYYIQPEARGLLGWCEECVAAVQSEPVQRDFTMRAFELGVSPPDWARMPSSEHWIMPQDARRRRLILTARDWSNANGRRLKRPVTVEDGLRGFQARHFVEFIPAQRYLVPDNWLHPGVLEPQYRDNLAEEVAETIAERSMNYCADDFWRVATHRVEEWRRYRATLPIPAKVVYRVVNESEEHQP